MTKDELIAKQQLEIEDYKRVQQSNGKTASQIVGMFISIGQPLNDNRLQMSIEQLSWCREVFNLITDLELPTDSD